MSWKELSSRTRIELLRRGNAYLGIGGVEVDGVPLRAMAAQPLTLELRSPDGLRVESLALMDEVPDETGIALRMQGGWVPDGLMEWMVHAPRARRQTGVGDRARLPAWVDLTLRPLQKRLRGGCFAGFQYQYRYRCDDRPIYRLVDRASWEPGGSATGCEFWMRNTFAPPIARFDSVQTHYSTEWYLAESGNPSVFQFLPFQTELQGFTFTVSPAGVLVTWASRVQHIRSLFEKRRGGDVIEHWHEHCDDLAPSLDSAPMEVLFAGGRFSREELIELYDAVREMVHEALHEQIGMRRERVGSYAVLEEWGPPDLDDYADRAAPALLEAGVRTIGLTNLFRNNMNAYGVSNMCCTVDWSFPDESIPPLRRLCDRAHAAGARVEMWGNTALSALAYLLSDRAGAGASEIPRVPSLVEALRPARDPFVRTPSGAIDADHYTPRFCVLNLRDPVVSRLWLDRWNDARERVGLDGIFLDSSFNLSSDKFHFVGRVGSSPVAATPDQTQNLGNCRPAVEPTAMIQSQYHAHLHLMAQMQCLGFTYNNEDIGVFGVHRHGPGANVRIDNLFMWSDCLSVFDRALLKRAGADPDEVFFRALAFRMMWMLYWVPSRGAISFLDGSREIDPPTPWHLSLLTTYDRVESLMRRPRVLSSDGGVVYEGEAGRVIWSFREQRIDLDSPHRVQDVLAGKSWDGASLLAGKHQVYHVLPADPRGPETASAGQAILESLVR